MMGKYFFVLFIFYLYRPQACIRFHTLQFNVNTTSILERHNLCAAVVNPMKTGYIYVKTFFITRLYSCDHDRL